MNDKTSSAQSGGVAISNNATDNNIFTGGVRDVYINKAPASGLTALHQVPQPPIDFVGREAEMTELLALVEQSGVTISGLQGLGGVGKTTLALKLAALLKARYPDAQFYLDLKGPSAQPTPAAEALKHVIRAYHPTAQLPESQEELRGLYLSVLDGQRALLLLDNARDETQIEPLLPPPGCLLLVTSRFHFTVPGLKVKSLDALSDEDAVKLLLEIAPRIGDHAAEIARLCGNLPLGLRLAASFLTTKRNFKVVDYLRRLRDASERLKLIDASLSLSYELLRPELQANWRTLFVFPDSFDQRAAAAVWDLDEDQTQEALSDLLNFSLVEWREETDRYRLHDLARVFAADRSPAAERLTCQQRHAEHFLAVLTEANDLYQQGGEAIKVGLALFDREWNNARAGWEWIKRHAETIPRALELCSAYPDAFTYIADLRQHPRERIAWLEVALAAAQKLGRKDAQTWHLGNLGNAYSSLGEIRRAIEFYEQVLAIARELGDRRGEGSTLGNLGNAYAELGETRRAIEFYEQDLAICRELGDRRGEGSTLGNLGNAYAELGETQRAIDFYEQSLSIKRELGDRRGEGATLGNLGNAYADVGETQRAIEFYEQDLAIARELGDRRGEGQTLGNLGNAYADLGETQRAIEFYEQVLAIARELGDRYSEGTLLWNAALALDELGDRAQAIAYAEAALMIKEQIEAPNAAEVRKQLAAWRGEGGAASE
ncbi:MAG: tetratricopeptide repeat protein [Acidobacteria bacterium]|nr:tetratricopeptide repeat protein [Acidobacteriota bacterium]